MATFNNTYAMSLIDNVDVMVNTIEHALSLHAENVKREVDTIAAFKAQSSDYYATFCAVKAILSAGMKLDANISAAHAIASAMMLDDTAMSWDDVDCIIRRAAPSCGSVSYGASVRAIAEQWNMLASLTAHDMTWNTLRNVKGLAHKTTSWALALWNANNNVFTLDRWMLRGISGVNDITTINDTEYDLLANIMLDIVNEYFPTYAPLVVQWSLWNEYRHAGQHASHIAIAQ